MNKPKVNPNWRPRLSINQTQEEYDRRTALIPHGIGRALWTALIDSTLDVVENTSKEERQKLFGAIVSGHIVVKLTSRKDD